MGLYGYERNNTPHLQKHYNRGNLIKFNNIITLIPSTENALRKILTIYGMNKHVGDSPDLFMLLKKSGYKTGFISNQGNDGITKPFINMVAIKSSDYQYFSDHSKTAITFNDEVILQYIENFLQENTSKKTILFVHLLGTHLKYSHRYASKFDYFKDQPKNKRYGSLDVVNDYDNSVLYNDYVMDEIYKIADKHNVKSVLYFSDHGDKVNLTTDFVGHSYSIVSWPMYRIPFLVYTKDEKLKQRLKGKESVFATTFYLSNFLHTYLGIKSNLYNEKYDFIGEKYYEPQKLKLCISDKYFYKNGEIRDK